MSKIARESFIEQMKKEYLKGSDSMYDILSVVKPSYTMTMEDSFLAYCELLNWSDKDAFLRVNQDDDTCKDITADREYKCTEIFVM